MPEPPRRNFGIRLPSELIEAIAVRAKATGQNKTALVEGILRDALGMEVGTDGPDLVQRLADIEQRLTDVEQRLAVSAQRRPTPPHTTPQTAPTAGVFRAEGEGLSLGDALVAAGAPSQQRAKYARLMWGRGNERKSRYVPIEEIPRTAAAVARGKAITQLERQAARIQKQIAAVEGKV
jgi:hypothetical protein